MKRKRQIRFGNRGCKPKDRPVFDMGTPELRAKRLTALGPQRKDWPSPGRTDGSDLLSALMWQGYLHPEYDQAKRMHDAGVTFAGWWVLVNPKCHPTGTLGSLMPGGGAEVDAAEAEVYLKNATTMLKRERAVYDAVVNFVVYGRFNPSCVDKLRSGLCQIMAMPKELKKAA